MTQNNNQAEQLRDILSESKVAHWVPRVGRNVQIGQKSHVEKLELQP